MFKKKSVPIPQEILSSPVKLFLFIAGQVYLHFFCAIVWLGLSVYAILNIIFPILHGSNTHFNPFILAGALLFIPIAITLEEFFHAAACIARGKAQTIRNIVIGYFDIKGFNLSLFYLAVEYNGKFNFIDKFYISAAGPITTLVIMGLINLTVIFMGIKNPVILIFIAGFIIPLLGIIPSIIAVPSDGYVIGETAKQLNIPFIHILIETFVSIKYPFIYCFSRKREFKDNYIDLEKAYQDIEKLMVENDLKSVIEIYEKLVFVNPYDAIVFNNLAWLYLESGKNEKALRYARRSFQLAPKDEEIRDTFLKAKLAGIRHHHLSN